MITQTGRIADNHVSNESQMNHCHIVSERAFESDRHHDLSESLCWRVLEAT
jgi:hypothetical protein